MFELWEEEIRLWASCVHAQQLLLTELYEFCSYSHTHCSFHFSIACRWSHSVVLIQALHRFLVFLFGYQTLWLYLVKLLMSCSSLLTYLPFFLPFQIGSYFEGQTGLEFVAIPLPTIPLPTPPKCWLYRSELQWLLSYSPTGWKQWFRLCCSTLTTQMLERACSSAFTRKPPKSESISSPPVLANSTLGSRPTAVTMWSVSTW